MVDTYQPTSGSLTPDQLGIAYNPIANQQVAAVPPQQQQPAPPPRQPQPVATATAPQTEQVAAAPALAPGPDGLTGGPTVGQPTPLVPPQKPPAPAPTQQQPAPTQRPAQPTTQQPLQDRGDPASGRAYTAPQLQVRTGLVNFYTDRGVPTHVAQGIADAVGIESSFDPTAMGDQNPVTGKYTSAGLFQAHDGRMTSLTSLANWQDPKVQYQWSWQQVHGGDPTATQHWNDILRAPDRATAAALWRQYFERPADSYTAGNLPSAQRYADINNAQIAKLQADNAEMRAAMEKTEPGSLENQQFLHKMMQNEAKMQEFFQDRMMHPPTRTPTDMMSNFGSLATLVGIFFGRASGAPLTASLNAGAAAMQAINDKNEQQYQDAFQMWKQQTGMAKDLMSAESNSYRDVLANEELSQREKTERLTNLAKINANDNLMFELQRGNIDKAVDMMKTQADVSDKWARTQKELEETHEKSQRDQDIKAQAQRDLKAWLPQHPNATPDEQQTALWGFEAQRRRQIATTADAGKIGELKNYELIDAKGDRTPVSLSRDASGQYYDDKNKPYTVPANASLRPMPLSSAGGGRSSQQVNSIIGAANEGIPALKNLVELPITATAGVFGGLQQETAHDLAEQLKRSAALHLTGDEAKEIVISFTGVGRSLARLENQGAATGVVGLSSQIDKLMPQEADTGPLILRKYAEIRQIIERSLEAVKATPAVQNAPDQMKLIDKQLAELKQIYPWTVHDVNALTTHSDQSVLRFAQHTMGQAVNAPPEAVDQLVANPNTRAQFDKIFGAGSAERILGPQ
jgi:hypothetical protein